MIPNPSPIPPEVEELAKDLYEGYATRPWAVCTDQRFWRERAQKLVDVGWRKTGLTKESGTRVPKGDVIQ